MTSHPSPNALGAPLTARDELILSFERDWPGRGGAKEDAIRAQFALSVARYYQLLNAVIDLPAAVQHDPMLVGRLLRARHERLQIRQQRAFRISDRRLTGPDDESND